MNRRPAHMDTYAGVYVFPGGRVEPNDSSEAMLHLTRGMSAEEAQQAFQTDLSPKLCLGHWVAAARELFEEAGLHYFVDQDGTRLNGQSVPLSGHWAAKRTALQGGTLGFAEMLASESLYCDLSQFSYFFHRVTPEHYPTRFDTRFYLAALPAQQVPLETSEEVAESIWISPQDALQRHQQQSFPIMPPTVAVLRILAELPSWEHLQKRYRLG